MGGGGSYPYGESYSPPINNTDTVGFATYVGDATGLDYAWNRYYSSTLGRLLSPDPKKRSMHPTRPQSFNRYAYVMNDPVTRNDPSGLECMTTDSGTMADDGTGGGCKAAGVDEAGNILPYLINVGDVNVQDGVVYADGYPIGEASLDEDYATELLLASAFRGVLSLGAAEAELSAFSVLVAVPNASRCRDRGRTWPEPSQDLPGN